MNGPIMDRMTEEVMRVMRHIQNKRSYCSVEQNTKIVSQPDVSNALLCN